LDAADTEKLGHLSLSYHLVEGVVAETGEVEGVVAETGEADGRVYLNFSKDWRTDFTIAVVPAFSAADGPMIVADHPE
jgi:hypothetical protein